jgi:hypothetical protein
MAIHNNHKAGKKRRLGGIRTQTETALSWRTEPPGDYIGSKVIIGVLPNL